MAYDMARYDSSGESSEKADEIKFLVRLHRVRSAATAEPLDAACQYAVVLGGDADPRRTEWFHPRGGEVRFEEEFVFSHDPDDAAPVLVAGLLRRTAPGLLLNGAVERVGEVDVPLSPNAVLPRRTPKRWLAFSPPLGAVAAAFLGCGGPMGGEDDDVPHELQVGVVGFRPDAVARTGRAYQRMRLLEVELAETRAERDDLLRRLARVDGRPSPPPSPEKVPLVFLPQGAGGASPPAADRSISAMASDYLAAARRGTGPRPEEERPEERVARRSSPSTVATEYGETHAADENALSPVKPPRAPTSRRASKLSEFCAVVPAAAEAPHRAPNVGAASRRPSRLSEFMSNVPPS